MFLSMDSLKNRKSIFSQSGEIDFLISAGPPLLVSLGKILTALFNVSRQTKHRRTFYSNKKI